MAVTPWVVAGAGDSGKNIFQLQIPDVADSDLLRDPARPHCVVWGVLGGEERRTDRGDPGHVWAGRKLFVTYGRDLPRGGGVPLGNRRATEEETARIFFCLCGEAETVG